MSSEQNTDSRKPSSNLNPLHEIAEDEESEELEGGSSDNSDGDKLS